MRVGFGVGITVGGGDGAANFPPIASFTTSAAGLTVTFTDTSTDLEGALVAWNWAFGDGSYSTDQNPVHAYAAEGTYSVTLVVRDAAGLTAHVTTSVEVILWEIDATSGIAVPADSDQWTNFLAANTGTNFDVPDHVWLFDEASGNLAAAVGGKTLTMTGTPSYQQTETGWARKFIRASGAAANQFANNGTMIAATSSALVLVFARIVQPVSGHQRVFYGSASSNAFEGSAGSSNMRYRTGASAANGASSHVGSVRPYVLVHDETANRMALLSNIEKVSPAFAARTGTTVQFQFGAAADTTALTSIGYACAWDGAKAERSDADIKALLEALGFTVTGY